VQERSESASPSAFCCGTALFASFIVGACGLEGSTQQIVARMTPQPVSRLRVKPGAGSGCSAPQSRPRSPEIDPHKLPTSYLLYPNPHLNFLLWGPIRTNKQSQVPPKPTRRFTGPYYVEIFPAPATGSVVRHCFCSGSARRGDRQVEVCWACHPKGDCAGPMVSLGPLCGSPPRTGAI